MISILSSLDKRNRWLVFMVYMFIVVGGLILLDFRDARRAEDNANRDYRARLEFCRDVEAIRAYARTTADRSAKTLPTIMYYKHHPSELKVALAAVHRQKQAFLPPRNCITFANELR